MSEDNNNRISIEDLPQAEQELTAEEAKDVKGGMLLPAVQAAREAARSTSGNVVAGNFIGTDPS